MIGAEEWVIVWLIYLYLGLCVITVIKWLVDKY